MGGIFVNCRRGDAGAAAACYQELSRYFGAHQVFCDCVPMSPAAICPAASQQALEQAQAVVVLIGPAWLVASAGGRRLVDQEQDRVRREIGRAFERGIAVVPVLLDSAPHPTVAELPPEIARLVDSRPARLRQRRFTDDVRRLAERLVEGAPGLLLARLFEPLPRLGASYPPSFLLRAEHRVVPFCRRDDELAALRRWVNGPGQFRARLLTGPAGQGKTRLADQLISQLRAAGWTAGFVPAELPTQVISQAGELRVPILLVVGDAERRATQLAGLAAALVARPAGTAKVRLLLLARAAGGWQQELLRRPAEAVPTELPHTTLSSLVPDARQRRGEFAQALKAFGAALGRPTAGAVVPLDLSDRHYGQVLAVHAAALAAVLDGTEPEVAQSADPLTAAQDPVARVLAHERRYWTRTGAAHRLPDLADLRFDQVVTVATLFGAPTPEQAVTVLGALPTFTGRPDEVHQFLCWVGDLYPGAGTLNPLRPDRLGEDLVAATVAGRPGVATGPAAVATADQLTRALTVLGRAAPRHRHLEAVITAVLNLDPQRSVPIAVAVARQLADSTALVRALSRVVTAQQNVEPTDDPTAHHPEQALDLYVSGLLTRAAMLGPAHLPEAVQSLAHAWAACRRTRTDLAAAVVAALDALAEHEAAAVRQAWQNTADRPYPGR